MRDFHCIAIVYVVLGIVNVRCYFSIFSSIQIIIVETMFVQYSDECVCCVVYMVCDANKNGVVGHMEMISIYFSDRKIEKIIFQHTMCKSTI